MRDATPSNDPEYRESKPMIEITLIAVVAVWAPITVKACKWIAEA